MTNILAFVIITICTNWTQIGTFTPKDGGTSSKVEQGSIRTNTIAVFTWNGAKKEFILDTKEGPTIGERKTLVEVSNIIMWTSNMLVTNINKGYWTY
jgi:hypothetical protein